MNAPAKVTTMPVSKAKAKMADLVRRAEAGEEVVLTRNGKVVARLVPPVEERAGKRGLIGGLEGKVWMAEDFDTLGPEWDAYTW